MRKSILVLLSFILVFLLNAQHNVYFYKTDNTNDVFSVVDVEDIIIDNLQEVILVKKKDGNTIQFLKSDIDSIAFSNYENTYTKTNEVLDVLDGCRSITWPFGGAGTHTGQFDMSYQGENVVSIEKTDSIDGNPCKFGRGYKFKKETPFLQFNATDGYKKIFQFNIAGDIVGSNVVKYVVGFWIDRRELKGLPLQFTSYNSGLWSISQENLLKVGYIAYQRGVGSKGFDQVEVIEVDGDFTYIVIRSDKNKANNPQLFNLIIEDNSAGISEITLWNPTLLYEEQNIDPYHIYLSESQKNVSPIRGKTITVIGDSQQNDAVISLGISRKLGVNIIHAPMGGHRVRYLKNTSLGQYEGWMYNWEARQKVLNIKADYYFLMISSNDSSGGGDGSETATTEVLNNYPVYGDDEATIATKTTLFNTLSESEKLTIFDFKQTYSAYVKQINSLYPDAKFLLSTIPISSFQATEYDTEGNTVYKDGVTAESQRTERGWIFQSIRDDIYELANKHGAEVCDLYNNGGITWENLPSKLNGEDSVHWTVEAKQLFVNPIIQSLLNMP